MSVTGRNLLKLNLPPIKFAFDSNFIIRSKRFRKLKEKPLIDTILVVDKVEEWHKQNYLTNKKHYPFFARFTTIKLVNYFQKKGAKIHFNTFTNEENKLQRYGIVDYDEFKNDLLYWRYLTVSTYMHKPYEVIVKNEDVSSLQEKNLLSAV
jgi:hypothetical protein